MRKPCFAVLSVVGIVACIVAVLLQFVGFPLIIQSEVEDNVKLKNGSEAYDRWEVLPIPITFKIYFFNVMNSDVVSKGGKPNFQEIGPYIYKQWRHKYNISEDEEHESALAYNEHVLFEFDANASFPLTEYDGIHIVNMPLVAIIGITENDVNPLLPFLDRAIDHIFHNPKDLFLKTTPRKFLFDGITLNCTSNELFIKVTCGIIDKLKPSTLVKKKDGNFKFALLAHKNNTDEGRFVMKNGLDDIKNVGEILSWKGSTNLNVWRNNTSCDKIGGRMGTHFPPFQDSSSEFYILLADLCRSVPLIYAHDAEYSGINGLRFIGKEHAFSSTINEPENQCYCLNKTRGIIGDNGCLLDGAMELWNCHVMKLMNFQNINKPIGKRGKYLMGNDTIQSILGGPIVFSYPHFHQAHEKYQSGVDGLHPDAVKHEAFLILEPNTGTPLKGSKRAQFNIFFRPIEKISLTTHLKTTLIPMIWIDEMIELDDELINKLNAEYFDLVKIAVITCWTIFGIGCPLCLIGMILYCCARKNRDDVINPANSTITKY